MSDADDQMGGRGGRTGRRPDGAGTRHDRQEDTAEGEKTPAEDKQGASEPGKAAGTHGR